MIPSLGDAGFDSQAWVQMLPDGAVSLGAGEEGVVLRASERLQHRFEELLEKRKAGTLEAAEGREYEAICRLDDALSWLNRMARRPPEES